MVSCGSFELTFTRRAYISISQKSGFASPYQNTDTCFNFRVCILIGDPRLGRAAARGLEPVGLSYRPRVAKQPS
jgi:hypothetical protein